ncbi:unnamed protein product [Haemonchus placei]|uniref:Uncharacterized protein n=1 Tax=Haemonchus placei TaxID=6290 RepID=A0A0N4WF79_HAEPC|nr:unnamed protein product [Haemonchus placei]
MSRLPSLGRRYDPETDLGCVQVYAFGKPKPKEAHNANTDSNVLTCDRFKKCWEQVRLLSSSQSPHPTLFNCRHYADQGEDAAAL